MDVLLFFFICLMASTLPACRMGTGPGEPAAGGGKTTQAPQPDHAATRRDTLRMAVHHYRVPCVGLERQLCLLVKEEGRAAWSYFYGIIEGFEGYRWGYTYHLIVTREEAAQPPQDASRYRYTLSRVVSVEPAGDAAFSFVLEPDDLRFYLRGSLEDGYMLLDEVSVACAAPARCTALAAARQAGRTVRLTFRHTAQDGVILLTAVEEL